MTAQATGDARRSAAFASLAKKLATIAGGGAKTSGNAEDMTSSSSIRQRETPPINGERNPKTTLDTRVSRIAKLQNAHGSTLQ
jgi:hypothetical protein